MQTSPASNIVHVSGSGTGMLLSTPSLTTIL